MKMLHAEYGRSVLRPVHFPRKIRALQRPEQLLCLRRLRFLEDLLDSSLLNDVPIVHHEHMLADPPHHGKLMRDEQNSHAVLLLKLIQKLEYPVARLRVERRRRLIEDQQPRPQEHRDGDHHTLPLPAGQFLRNASKDALRLRELDLHKGVRQLFILLLLRQMHVVVREHFPHLTPDRHRGVQRRHRLLEHHRHHVAAEHRELFLRAREHIDRPRVRAKQDFPRHTGRIGQKAHNGQRRHALAAAGFADNSEPFARMKRKIHILDDRLQRSVRALKADGKVAHAQHRAVGKIFRMTAVNDRFFRIGRARMSTVIRRIGRIRRGIRIRRIRCTVRCASLCRIDCAARAFRPVPCRCQLPADAGTDLRGTSGIALIAGVRITQQRHAEHREHEDQTGEQHRPRRTPQVGLALGKHTADAGLRRLNTEA